MEKEKTCPKCGSEEVSRPKWSPQGIALGILLLGIPLPFLWKEAHCFDCGNDFKVKRNK